MVGARRSSDVDPILSATGTAATINVTTLQQGVINDPTQCSLQEAIYASEFKSNTAVSQTDPDVTYNTGCTAGTGDDIILLAPGALYPFHDFWKGDGHNINGPTATPVIFSKIRIEGNGATLQWQGVVGTQVNSRLFAIGTVNDVGFPSGSGGLILRNVYVKGFLAKGGDGGKDGGGGGLGAGGAIYVHGGLSKSKIAPSRTTVQSAATAAPTPALAAAEEADCRETAVSDAPAPPVVAAVRVATGATGDLSSWQVASWVAAVVGVAERFFRARTVNPRTPGELVAPAAFSKAATVGTRGTTARTPKVQVVAVAVAVVVMASVWLSTPAVEMGRRVASAAVVVAAWEMVDLVGSAAGVARGVMDFFPCTAGMVTLEAAADLSQVPPSFIRAPAKVANLAAMLTRLTTAAVVGRWGAPSSVRTPPSRWTTAPSSTIS
jgi:hypothetical protein